MREREKERKREREKESFLVLTRKVNELQFGNVHTNKIYFLSDQTLSGYLPFFCTGHSHHFALATF